MLSWSGNSDVFNYHCAVSLCTQRKLAQGFGTSRDTLMILSELMAEYNDCTQFYDGGQ